MSTFDIKGKKILSIDPQALTLLSEQAFTDVSHLLRPSHLQVSVMSCCLDQWYVADRHKSFINLSVHSVQDFLDTTMHIMNEMVVIRYYFKAH